MKKSIKIKSSKLLAESSIKVGEVDYENKLRKRVVDLRRARDMAAAAKQRAEANGQSDIAQKLEDKIVELDDLLATYNTDTIDDTGAGSTTSSNSDTKNSKDKSDDSDGSDNSDSEADTSDEGDDDDDSTGKQGDKDDDDSDGDGDTSDESDRKGKQDKEKKGDPENKSDDDSDEGGVGDPKDNDESGEDENGDPGTKSKKSDPEEMEDDGDEGGGGDRPLDPDEDSDNEGGGGDPGARSKKNNGDFNISDDSGDGDSGDGADSSQSSNSKSKSKGDKKNDSGDTDRGSESDGDDSDEDNDSNNDSNEQSDGKNSQSKTKPSLDPNDSNTNSNAQPEYKNPFADSEDIPAGLSSMPMGGEPLRDATIEETIELLKTLKGEGREGAIDALKDLIAKRKLTNNSATESFQNTGKEALVEAVKRVRDMTDDEFGDYINGVYDLIDQADDLEYVDNVETRKAKITDWANDPLTAQELAAEDNIEIQKDFQKKKALEREKARYSRVGTLDQFKLNFYNAVKHQVEMVRQEYQSYEEINPEYESEDIIMKADIIRDLPEEAIPIIDVYFDVSASWGMSDIEIGKQAIASIKEFEDAGEIKLNIFYFGDDVSPNFHEVANAGTTGWRKILQNIKATDAQNVVVMTDDDIEQLGTDPYLKHHYGQFAAVDGPTCKVDGCVWFLWKNGLSSPSCVQHLIGRQGNYQYSFNA